jgi:hypothetical protein
MKEIEKFIDIEWFLLLVRKKLRKKTNCHTHTKQVGDRIFITTFYHTTEQVNNALKSVLYQRKARTWKKKKE